MAFIPETAYAADYQYIDGIETVALIKRPSGVSESPITGVKAKRRNFDRRASATLGIASIAVDETLFVIWNDTIGSAVPEQGDELRTADPGGVTYTIQSASNVGWQTQWLVLCRRHIVE